MRKLIVNIERNGSMVYAGEIIGSNQSDASFFFRKSFLSLQKKNTKCQDNIMWLICSLF